MVILILMIVIYLLKNTIVVMAMNILSLIVNWKASSEEAWKGLNENIG